MKLYRPILIFVFFLLCSRLDARPVHNRAITLHQPDGKTIKAFIHGDEFFHTIKDSQGHNLIKDSEGYWCYASYAPNGRKYSSGYLAGEDAPSSILSASKNIPEIAIQSERRKNFQEALARDAMKKMQKLNITEEDPIATEKRMCTILLVEFADKKMTYTKQDFENMVMQEGYSRDGASGSINDYLNDQFRGDIEFSYQISDIITLDNNCENYFGNSENDSDINAAAAVAEACQKASKSGINFSLADSDLDGEVDNVFLFVAGLDEADGGGEECVWSHMYYLEYSQFKGLAVDGKIINNYAISTELKVTDQDETQFTSIGTFCHEYGHALGLKDMYDTDYKGSGGQGNGLWLTTGIMDGGNGNNNFNTPPNYNAIDYDTIGLGMPETLKTGHYELEAIHINRRFLKMETGNPGEYYLIEHRDNTGWDKHIGGSGLLIYHIDKSEYSAGHSDWYGSTLSASERWEYNEVNCNPNRQCAKLISATDGINAFNDDGIYNNNCSLIFYPNTNNNSFSPTTTPAFVFWDGTESPLAITSISKQGDKICFDVTQISDIIVPEIKITHTDVFQNEVIIQWESSISDFEEAAHITWGITGEETQSLEVEPYDKGKYAIRLENLKHTCSYQVNIIFKTGGISSKEVTVNFTTKREYDNHPFIFLNNVARNEDGSFSKGTMLPLIIFNHKDCKDIQWYMGNTGISPGANGYYKLSSSGKLKAIITNKDGSKDILIKEIRIR